MAPPSILEISSFNAVASWLLIIGLGELEAELAA